MREQEPPARIVITVERGVVQTIYATKPVEALVVDYDDLTDAEATTADLTRGVADVIVTKDWAANTDEDEGIPRGTNARIAAFLHGDENWIEI